MKRYIAPIAAWILVAVGLSFTGGCSNFVQDIEPPIDEVQDQFLDESQIPYEIIGLQQQFGQGYGQSAMLGDLLSDQCFFDTRVQNATFPTYANIDQGNPLRDNNSTTAAMLPLGRAYYISKDLIERVNRIGTFQDESLRQQALYNAYLYGGLVRFTWASYYGLGPDQGGGFDEGGGPFVPSAQLYDRAVALWTEALQYANEVQQRTLYSLIARAHLYNGKYAQARDAAQRGMRPGDAPFVARYSTQDNNPWYFGGGRGRTQIVVADRFQTYLAEDPAEASRIPIERAPSAAGTVFYRQAKYPDRESSLPIITWQENHLMLAELALRLDNDATTALTLVNEVRASRNLSPLSAVDLDVIYVERDKELFVQGQRLMDQRRFNRWHLPAGTWKYLEITERERLSNPNLGG